jgi:hypothetical protein
LDSGVAYEVATEVSGDLLNTCHQQCRRKRAFNATPMLRDQSPQRRADGASFLVSERIDLHIRLLDRTAESRVPTRRRRARCSNFTELIPAAIGQARTDDR